MRLMNTTGAAQTGALTGSTFFIHDTRRAHLRTFSFELVSGTVTFVLEGRVSDDQSWTSISTASADTGAIVAAWPQMRIRLSAATAAVVIADIDADGRLATGRDSDRTDN